MTVTSFDYYSVPFEPGFVEMSCISPPCYPSINHLDYPSVPFVSGIREILKVRLGEYDVSTTSEPLKHQVQLDHVDPVEPVHDYNGNAFSCM